MEDILDEDDDGSGSSSEDDKDDDEDDYEDVWQVLTFLGSYVVYLY